MSHFRCEHHIKIKSKANLTFTLLYDKNKINFLKGELL
jgi:hypothetical protein